MALLQKSGSITAFCPTCNGGKSTFEYSVRGAEIGSYERPEQYGAGKYTASYRLFRCAGCGAGAFAKVFFYTGNTAKYPGSNPELAAFFPEAASSLPIPPSVPHGIKTEFREAEKCLAHGCHRAAAGLFRSVLDKTLNANGYRTEKENNLYKQIEAAADDGVITAARKVRAHSEVRVLGNDVLHDEWHEIAPDDVEASRHYCQRILEDFYDDRSSVLKLLNQSNRVLPVATVVANNQPTPAAGE